MRPAFAGKYDKLTNGLGVAVPVREQQGQDRLQLPRRKVALTPCSRSLYLELLASFSGTLSPFQHFYVELWVSF